MPIHDFSCEACGGRFEELVRPDELPPCPACGSDAVVRLVSQVSPPARVGLRGAAARRSEAARREQRERRREGG
ncbi:MAG TPA: zinc ribbon domain-containing protein [Thermoleophilaceae bacterium]|nr:zinc ribbon domain-containing protein [Thermoleophilaceae bacterium]